MGLAAVMGLAGGCDRQAETKPSDTERQASGLRINSQRAILAGDVDEAGRLLDDAIDLAPTNAHLRLERADVYALQGRHQDAAAAYAKATGLAKETDLPGGLPEAALGSALVHQAMGDEAVVERKLALARKGFQARLPESLPDDPVDWSRSQVHAKAHLAYIRALQGDPQGGLDEVQGLLKARPGDRMLEQTILAIQENLDGTDLPKDLAR